MSDTSNLPEKKYPSDPSERARMLVAEGKIGGKRAGSGRPRKKRAAEIVAEEAQRNASKIVTALKDALDDKQPANVRLAAAKEWLSIENKEAELQLKEERAFEETPLDELIDYIVQGFTQIAGANGPLTYEGTATELEPQRIDRVSSADADSPPEDESGWTEG